MPTHLPLETVADFAAGILPPEAAAEADRHLTECAQCAGQAAALARVTEQLAADPLPTMPDDVFNRIDAALTAQSDRRASGEVAALTAQRQSEHAERHSLGSFGENSPTHRHTGISPTPSQDEPPAQVRFGDLAER